MVGAAARVPLRSAVPQARACRSVPGHDLDRLAQVVAAFFTPRVQRSVPSLVMVLTSLDRTGVNWGAATLELTCPPAVAAKIRTTDQGDIIVALSFLHGSNFEFKVARPAHTQCQAWHLVPSANHRCAAQPLVRSNRWFVIIVVFVTIHCYQHYAV